MDYLSYTYQIGFMICIIILALTHKAVINSLKLMWYRRKAIKLEFINADGTKNSVIAMRKGAEFEYKQCKFFLNPKKAILESGVKTFTYVNLNSMAHDYFNKPEIILQKLIKEAIEINVNVQQIEKKRFSFKSKVVGEKKVVVKDISDQFHDIYAEPYRIDARLLQEAMTKAQLSATAVFDKIIKLFTNKNLVTMAVIIAAASGAAAVLGWLIFDSISQGVVCTNLVDVAQTLRP